MSWRLFFQVVIIFAGIGYGSIYHPTLRYEIHSRIVYDKASKTFEFWEENKKNISKVPEKKKEKPKKLTDAEKRRLKEIGFILPFNPFSQMYLSKEEIKNAQKIVEFRASIEKQINENGRVKSNDYFILGGYWVNGSSLNKVMSLDLVNELDDRSGVNERYLSSDVNSIN